MDNYRKLYKFTKEWLPDYCMKDVLEMSENDLFQAVHDEWYREIKSRDGLHYAANFVHSLHHMFIKLINQIQGKE